MRNNLTRLLFAVAALIALPAWWLHARLARVEPIEFFLRRLERRRRGPAWTIALIVVLGNSARNFDALSALRAARSLEPPFPLWVLTPRHVKLLLEASLWLGDTDEFHRLWGELLRNRDTPREIHQLTVDYMAIARDEVDATERIKDELVLPALHWDRHAARLHAHGRIDEERDALYQALRFVPANDPRRSGLVARLIEANVVGSTLGDAQSQGLRWGDPGA
jgi:hypothetical protein